MQLERICGALVEAIRTSDPGSLHKPHKLRDVQHRFIPYRKVRDALGLSCSEDHEMLLLRLMAGEGGFLDTEREAQEVFRIEIDGVNPDLGLLDIYGSLEVRLTDNAIRAALIESDPGATYRPPGEEPEASPEDEMESTETPVIPLTPPTDLPTPPPIPEPTSLSDLDTEPDDAAGPDAGERVIGSDPAGGSNSAVNQGEEDCAYCGGRLPRSKRASFCPHCGQNLDAIRCARCNAELEFGWKHCISCGHPVPEA